MSFIYKYGKHGKLWERKKNLEKVVKKRSFDSCWKEFFYVCVNLGASFQISSENMVI